MKTARSTQPVLGVLLLVWGAVLVITQSILLRETTVLFFAGEIAWGIVLFAWLVGVGVGAWLGGCVSRRTERADRWLGLVVSIFALAGPVSITVLRNARGWLDIGPGQYIPMDAMVWLSGLLVSPFGVLIGVAFPLACKAARSSDDSARIGWVYLVESAGSLIGGLAFTFLLAGRVCATIASGVCGVTLLAVSAAWLYADKRVAQKGDRSTSPVGTARDGSGVAAHRAGRDRGLAIAVGGVACILAGAVIGVGHRLDDWSILRRWRTFAPGLDLRASVDSRYQNLALGWREGQFELYANGHPTATFPEPTALRWDGQVAMCQHPDPRWVLLLGGGVDGMLAEVLTHRCVQRVDYVELDAAALRLVRPHLSARDRRALDDERVAVIHQDARRFVQGPVGPYDLVIGRFGPPSSALVARFYTVEFYRRLADVTGPNGVLVFQSETSPGELRPESAACTRAIYWTLKQAFDDVIVGWGSRPVILACKQPGTLTTDATVLGRRLAGRGVSPDHFAAADFGMNDQLDVERVARRRSELHAVPEPAVTTDLHPRIYLLWLQRWEQQMNRRSVRQLERVDEPQVSGRRIVFARLDRFSPSVGAGALVLALMVWLGWRWVRHGRDRGLGAGVVLGSIASTGVVTMAGVIVLLFAYQSLIGYVYEQIGAVVGLFMLGLVLGSGVMNRSLAHRAPGRWWLVGIDLGLAGLAAAMPTIFVAIGGAGREWTVTLAVYGLMTATGVLGGGAFPLAARIHGGLDRRTDRTAGAIDAADHTGACLGALLTGVVLVPAIGIGATCLCLAGLKAVSAAAVALGAHGPRPITTGTPASSQ